MVERTINKDVLDSINKFIEEIKKKDFDEESDYFIKEVIDTGRKVA